MSKRVPKSMGQYPYGFGTGYSTGTLTTFRYFYVIGGKGKNYIFGYARVSTEAQNLDRQLDALKRYGVDFIYNEKMTGQN